MAVFNEPSKWQTSLVNSGDANTIPQTTPAGTGEASFEDGFPQITQVPIGAGGIAPDRKDFNGLFKVLGDWIFFAQNGGLPTYSASFDYVVGRYVVYNNTLYKCIQANGASSTVVAPDSVSPLGSDYWKDIENQDSTSLIPNQTIVSELPLTDANLHLKDGALLSGSGAYSAYVDLIAELYNGGSASSSFCTEAEWQTSNTNYGFCNKFVYDSVNNTVRLPKVNSEHGALIKSYSSGANWYRIYQDGWCEQGGTFPKADSYQGRAITLLVPYIDTNYSINAIQSSSSETQQAPAISAKTTLGFTCHIYNSTAQGFSTWTTCGYIDVSDLQTSPIYEYIVVGTVTKTDIQIDIDNILADLANKAEKDFSNVTNPVQAFKDMSVGWGMPDYSSGVVLSVSVGQTWTAPENCFISVMCDQSSNVLLKLNDSSGEWVTYQVTTSSNASSNLVPIEKGTIIYVNNFSVGGALTKITYYPCKGAN